MEEGGGFPAAAADLVKKKDEIERTISEMVQILESNGSVGMDAPLVDKEGYPRSDINIYAVREARNKVICLRNDHKKVMKLIEDKLYLLHADAREKGTVSVGGVSGGAHPMKEPFATVTMVTPGSPAALSGLCVGDRLIGFGSVNKGNFNSIQDIGNVVQHSEGKSVRVVLVRDTGTINLTLVPRKWAGRGLLGCTIVPQTS